MLAAEPQVRLGLADTIGHAFWHGEYADIDEMKNEFKTRLV